MKKKLLRAIARSMAVVSRRRKRFADIFEKIGVVLSATSVLVTEDIHRGPGVLCEEKHQIVLQIIASQGGQSQGSECHLVVVLKLKACDATIGSDEFASLRKYGHPVVPPVGYVDVALAVDGDAGGVIQRHPLIARAAEAQQDKYQYLRSLSLAVRGTVPTIEEFQALHDLDEVPPSYRGVALYADWEISDEEWETFESWTTP